ncbi:hypothetical protein LINPERHAP2_LOCUS754 [Linum perenne]
MERRRKLSGGESTIRNNVGGDRMETRWRRHAASARQAKRRRSRSDGNG